LRNGIELIFQKLLSALKKQGVEPIEAIGQAFDPQIHEAIFQVEDKEKPSNIVVDEATKGYRHKDKVLRFSKVVVNK
jgi:molecular chaperone GrpE